MYRLYGGIDTLILMDISYTERDIIETINEVIAGLKNPRFIIIKNTNDQDKVYKLIYSYEDFLEYVDDYRKRNPDFYLYKKRTRKR